MNASATVQTVIYIRPSRETSYFIPDIASVDVINLMFSHS